MSKWYVKELSKITGVTVQTLHHYDRINLLKPSFRLPNGYRVYNQSDLLKLQQIIALKFFGFELSHIGTLLASDKDTIMHFKTQVASLQAKANTLLEASKVLQQVVDNENNVSSIRWQDIIKLIEVYRMSEQLEHPWVKEIFTPEELNQYTKFETEWKQKSSAEQKAAFEKNWGKLVQDIEQNLANDPSSAMGIAIGGRCMQMVNAVYGRKYAHLRTKKFNQGFAQGKGLDEVGLTPAMVTWLDEAMDAYWRERIFNILKKVGSNIPDQQVVQQWQDLLIEMCGDDEAAKKKIVEAAISDKDMHPTAKAWLKDVAIS